jgi:hypothetical protein
MVWEFQINFHKFLAKSRISKDIQYFEIREWHDLPYKGGYPHALDLRIRTEVWQYHLVHIADVIHTRETP